MTHPTLQLNDIVHQRSRLGILTVAAEADRVEFGYLRESLDLTAGNLSRHLDVLLQAGLIDVDKGYHGRRPRTWVSINKAGRIALNQELSALLALIKKNAKTDREQ